MTPYKKDSEVVRDLEETFSASGLGHLEGNKIVKKDYQPMTLENVKSILLQTRHDDLRAIEEKIEGMMKKKGTEVFETHSGPTDEIWSFAKPVKPNIKRLVYNAALSDLLAFIQELKK